MTQQDYANLFKSLSHTSRLRLLELLARRGEMSVSQLAEAMPREGSTVSRHLNLMNLYGIVNVRQEAQNRLYSLNLERLKQVFHDFLIEELDVKPPPECPPRAASEVKRLP